MSIGVGAAIVTAVGVAANVGIGFAIAAAIDGLIVGAVIGGLTAAVTGGDIMKGILYGAIGGAVTSGLTAAIGGAGGVAGGVASGAEEGVTVNTAMAQNMTNVATGVEQTGEGIMGAAASQGAASATQGAIGSFLSEHGAEMAMNGVSTIAKNFMDNSAAKDAREAALDAENQKFEHDKEKMKLQAELTNKYGLRGGGGGGGQNHDALIAAREKIKESRRIRAENRKNFENTATSNINKFKLNGGDSNATDKFAQENIAQEAIPVTTNEDRQLQQAVPTPA